MTGLPVRCLQLRHTYRMHGEALVALDGIDLELEAGTSNAISGPSGSGKSTLVNLLAGLQRPSSGHVFIGEHELSAMTPTALLRIRAERVATAVQNPSRNLLPFGDPIDNIRFAQRGPRSYRRRVDLPDPAGLLGELGLGDLAGVAVDRLSGGERQRVALAVAMANHPAVLIADEPTSQLDSANRDRVADILRLITTRFGTTVVAVTHDPQVAEALDRTIRLRDGRIVEDSAA
ncbi:MAG: ABC transporter ATP-binding protein [Jatrophihabitans sp.]|uniref:ABC transporter ATP-binding protein n=1 Tax=Jatrophihabitans sp. TaxID=1932789 RepID=UPI003F7DA363